MTAERVKCSRATILAAAEIECVAIPAVTPAMILQHDRRAAVSWIRARTIQRIYATGKYSTTGIGRAFGMDHSSIVQNLRRDTSGKPPVLHALTLEKYLRLSGHTPPAEIKDYPVMKARIQAEISPHLPAPPMARLMGRRA